MRIIKISFLIICVASLFQVKAQSNISATILDEESMEPLPYVNVSVEGSERGTVSNEEGRFSIKDIAHDVTLFVSYLGYESQNIKAAKANGKLILLKSKAFRVDEINIVSRNFNQDVLLGVRNEKGRGPSFAFGNPQLGTELGVILRIEEETYIKTAHFVLNHAKGDSLLMRLNVYDFSNGEIGEKVLLENVYIREKQRKGTFTIDLTEHEVILHDDVIVSLEWLKNFDDSGNKNITFDTKKAKKKDGSGLIRPSQASPFKKPPIKTKYKPCIYLKGKQNGN